MKKFKLFKMLAVLIVLITSINSAWADLGYNGESHVYLKINDVTKYYKVSTESWSTGASLPGTWGGVLSEQTLSSVLNIQIVGGAVGGWTDSGASLSGNLSYKVTQSSSKPGSWDSFGSIAASNTYGTGGNAKNCFYYKNNGSTEITPNAAGTYYLHVKIVDGQSNERYSYVAFTVPSFTVTYNANGGSGTTAANTGIVYNNSTTLKECGFTGPSGYHFAGWNTASDYSGDDYVAGASFTVTEDVTLYAKWAKTIYVYDNLSWNSMNLYTWDSNNGDKKYNGNWPGQALSQIGSTKWYQMDIVTGPNKFILNNNSAQTEDIIIASYAPSITDGHSYEIYDDNGTKKLREKKLTVSFNMKSHGSAVSSQSKYYNELVTEPSPAPSETGYTFGGWYKETGCTNAWNFATDRVTAATTLYAKWTANEYTTSNNIKESDGTTNKGTYKVTYDATSITYTTAPTKTGYSVEGLYYETSLTNKIVNSNRSLVSSSSYTTGGKWTTTSAPTLYVKWAANTYAVTLAPNGGSGSNQAVTATYDAAMPSTLSDGETAIVAPTKTGYDFDGYWYTTTQYYDGDLNSATNWNMTTATTLNAKWNAISYTITLTQEGETGYGSAGSTSVSATYDSSMPAIGSLPTAATGYKFQGYFTESNGGGAQFTNAAGVWQTVDGYIEGGNWVNAGTLTLYAFFEKAELTGFTYSPSTVAPGNDMTVTPVVSPTPTGTTCICWKLFYDIACTEEVPAENYTITSSPSSGASSITLTAPTASGTYYLQGTLRTGSVCNAGDVLSTYKQACVVESDHKMTIRYICDDETISGNQEVIVPAGDSVGVKAAVIDGYTFSEWVLPDVLQRATDAATGDSITIKARYDGTLTVKYIETPRVYFYNNLGWSKVYVTFDANWSESQGTGNQGKYYYRMTQIDGTDIWYHEVPSYYTSNAFEHWSGNIAFNDTEFGPEGYYADNEYRKVSFNSGHAVYRRDFDPYNTFFIPAPESVVTHYDKNGVAYHSTSLTDYLIKDDKGNVTSTEYYYNGGYWKKYNKTYSGYSLRGTFGGIIGSESDWDGSNHDLYADNVNDSVYKTSLQLNANWNYYFRIYRNQLKNDVSSAYTNNGTMTCTGSHTGWRFETKNTWRSNNCTLSTATAGVYTFYVTFKKNGTIYVSVEYPDAPGDFQVLYSDNTTGGEWFKSDVIASDAVNAKVSFFYRPGNSPVLKWKKSTAVANNGTITWGADNTFTMTGFSSVLNHDSVYVFYLSNVNNNLQMDSVKAYTGEYYIRTNCANKYKWDRYKDSDHRMSYSEFSEKNSGYTHYFMKYAAASTDVRFVVANDYSPAISDTLVQMAGDVSVSPAYTHVSSAGVLAANANIRFMWNSHTNELSRAYLAAAKDDGTEFLVMQGVNGKLFDTNGNDLLNASAKGSAGYNHKAPNNAIQFSDIENWVYEANVKAKPGTFVKLYAKYDNGTFYYKGDNSGTFDKDHAFTLLGGTTGDSKLDIRVVYDFKTDRLMAAYVPTAAAVTDTIAINADIMFIRHHQEAPTAITFGETSGKLDEVKTVYGVVRLNRWQISNRQHPEDDNVDHCKTQELINTWHPLVDVGDMTSEYERSFYFISFPFDVNLSEVIGIGTYGVHWGIMYYDGKGRAKNGYWADSEVNWKYFTIEEMRTKKLNAYEGYVIGIDPDLMYYTNTNIWTNNCSNLEIFFPSRTTIGNITKQAVKVPIDQTGYECKIDRRTDAEKEANLKDINKNRTIADSYWHCIGVPTYADLTEDIVNPGEETPKRLEWGNKNLLYVYHWSKIDNSMTAVNATRFEFETMKSYLVQYAGDTISWSAASAGPRAIAARQNEEDIHFAEFNLAILQNEEKQDQTFVRLSDDENITEDFDFNYDLGKSFNANKANIYTLAEGYVQAAANCMPFSNQTTVVPVGVKIVTDGEYTFSIPEGTNGVGVVLVDNIMGTRTNLALTDYTVNLTAGTYDERFELELSPIAQTPTDVETISDERLEISGVRKVMVDGILYIVKDGKVFDAQGNRVR